MHREIQKYIFSRPAPDERTNIEKDMYKMRPKRLTCFVALPHSLKFSPINEAIQNGANEAGYKVVSLDKKPVLAGSTIQEALIGELALADCIVADISGRNPNVFFELGLAQAMGKGILIIADERSLENVPFDIRPFRVITYSNEGIIRSDLAKKIHLSLLEFRRFPQQKSLSPNLQLSLPFFIDWGRLPPREVENLCQELLAQMGFRRLDWGKGTPEIDLIAELPKKDPDGFEYRELWLVSLGLRAPVEMLIKMATREPEYLIHHLMRYSERFEEMFSRQYESSMTLLLVLFTKTSNTYELEMLKEQLEKRRYRKEPYGLNIRLRIWDQDYLTSLVQRFPHIGYKYFSDEGRIRSKTRKSYEELYRENSISSTRLAQLNSELEEEKNKRVRAERDSVWKDISFAAAHKIGNPIFAIETDLDPLLKRIGENRQDDAVEVIDNIRSAVEKAKGFVEQFKSLARAQEIKLVPTNLKPIFEESCKQIINHSVKCKIECPSDLLIQGDFDRLGECFDELVMNSIHWFDKPEKKIEIVVTSPAPGPLPDFLDTAQNYIVVHVRDNGCGIQASDKNRIFEAFFTKYEHGTGLGLALVRRIIDGHGGGIIESGIPGTGADFEIYLPLSIKKDKLEESISKKQRFSKKITKRVNNA